MGCLTGGYDPPFAKKGDYITAEAWNSLAEGVRRLSRLHGSPPIEVTHGIGGPIIKFSGPKEFRPAITVRDNTNKYPAKETQPDTYAFKYTCLKYDWTKGAGKIGHTTNYLDNSTKYDGYVQNLISDGDNHYIPEATEILIFLHDGQWYTAWCCETDNSSSSLSVSVSSLSSQSNSSSSSSSRSSLSSASSVSSASSRSSNSSSSSSRSSASSQSFSSPSSQSSKSSSSLSSQSSQSRSSFSSLSSQSSRSRSSQSSQSLSSRSSQSSVSAASSLSSQSSQSSRSRSSASSASSQSSASSASSASSQSPQSASSLSSQSFSSASSLSSQSRSSASSASSRSASSLSSLSIQSASSLSSRSSASSASSASSSSQSASSLSSLSQSSVSLQSQSSLSASSASSQSTASSRSSISCSATMKEWHRFMLLERLDPAQPLGQASKADAAVVDWSAAQNKYVLTGEIITVHDWQGRHFGLPYEYGWAKCTDASAPEIVDLGGLFRRGVLDADLEANGSAFVSIWEATGGGAIVDSGYNLLAFDFLLPPDGFLLEGTLVDVQYSQLSQRWCIVNPARPPIVLGKNEDDDIANNASGTVTVYGVPEDGGQGDEEAGTRTFTAFNKTFGLIPKDTWLFCELNDDGWYIVATERGDHLVGRIKPGDSSSSVNLNVPPVTAGLAYLKGNWIEVSVQLCPSDQGVIQDSSVTATVNAAVRHRPMLDGESVVVVWTGSIFTIVAGQFDGGILCRNTTTDLEPGTAAADGSVSVDVTGSNNPAAFLQNTNGRIFSPLGTWPANKLGWLSWNAGGGFVTAAQC